MNTYRTLKLSAYWKWGWQKKTSLFMTAFSIFFAVMSWPMLSMMPKEEKIDVESIIKQGATYPAEVIAIGVNSRITVNGVNPSIIAYRYSVDGIEKEGRHQTMDFVSAQTTKIGDLVSIKSLGDNSVIEGISVYQFPYEIFNLFYILPITFGGLSIIYLALFFRKKIMLHTRGTATQAVIDSIEPLYYIRRIGFKSRSKNHHRIYFSYIDSNEQPQSASDVTTDKLLVRDSKKGDLIDIVYFQEKPESAGIFEHFLTKSQPVAGGDATR